MDELKGFLKDMGMIKEGDELLTDMQNDEGKAVKEISFRNFMRSTGKILLSSEFDEEMIQAFQMIDTDGGGYIEKEELEGWMHALGEDFSDAELKVMMGEAYGLVKHEADADPEKIKYREFKTILLK